MCQAMLNSSDYLETLQQAALGFLRRHRDEHLGEQELFSRTVGYLVNTMSAPQAIAENTVARAYGELRRSADQRHIDIGMSTENVAVLVDPRTGTHYIVPVALIFDRLIDAPQRRRLSLVKTSVH